MSDTVDGAPEIRKDIAASKTIETNSLKQVAKNDNPINICDGQHEGTEDVSISEILEGEAVKNNELQNKSDDFLASNEEVSADKMLVDNCSTWNKDSSIHKYDDLGESNASKRQNTSELSTPHKVFSTPKSSKYNDSCKLTFSTLKQKKQEVDKKSEVLRKLKMIQRYRSKNNLDGLETLIVKWRSACQEALTDLQENANCETKPSRADILNAFNIDHKLVCYDPEQDCFYDP